MRATAQHSQTRALIVVAVQAQQTAQHDNQLSFHLPVGVDHQSIKRRARLTRSSHRSIAHRCVVVRQQHVEPDTRRAPHNRFGVAQRTDATKQRL
jgi:hypothetical protein